VEHSINTPWLGVWYTCLCLCTHRSCGSNVDETYAFPVHVQTRFRIYRLLRLSPSEFDAGRSGQNMHLTYTHVCHTEVELASKLQASCCYAGYAHGSQQRTHLSAVRSKLPKPTLKENWNMNVKQLSMHQNVRWTWLPSGPALAHHRQCQRRSKAWDLRT